MPTLSLKLPPKVAKLMPWIVSAKASGNPKLAEWAEWEYQSALREAREREQRQRDREEWKRLREYELREQERECLEYMAESRARDEYLKTLGIHYALEDGWEEIQPTQSSQKGWRRLLSEHADERERWYAFGWGGTYDRANWNKRNCGRKPRKPWYR